MLNTHIVLGEIGNVACYSLKPVQAVFSCGKLYDTTANSIHSYDLESVFPEEKLKSRIRLIDLKCLGKPLVSISIRRNNLQRLFLEYIFY